MFDLVNGSFEIVGGLAQILNIKQLMKDKQVKGVSWPVTGFFTVWGLWNILFYSHLDQWFSFFGGILLTITNLIWLLLLLKYRNYKNASISTTISNSNQLVHHLGPYPDLRSLSGGVAEYFPDPNARAGRA